MKLSICRRSRVSIILATLTLGLSMLSCSKPDNQLEDLLKVLDNVIENQQVYKQKRLDRIETCRKRMMSARSISFTLLV